MCNVYSQPPIDVFEDYIRRHRGQMPLPGWPLPNPDKRHVGPFETGNFLTAAADGQLVTHTGQWGMIRPGQKSRIEYRELPAKKPGAEPKKVPMLKNNARLERVASSPAFRDAWKNARRCLIPAEWLQEPNWETGRCIWWKLRRADRMPWMVAGIWSEWTDPESGEIVPNYAMITLNVNGHPLLNRLHKPEVDKVTRRPLPLEQQDKRAEAHIEPEDWTTWLSGDLEVARELLVPAPREFYDQDDATRTDAALAAIDA